MASKHSVVKPSAALYDYSHRLNSGRTCVDGLSHARGGEENMAPATNAAPSPQPLAPGNAEAIATGIRRALRPVENTATTLRQHAPAPGGITDVKAAGIRQVPRPVENMTAKPQRRALAPVFADAIAASNRLRPRPAESAAATPHWRMLPLSRPSEAQLRLLLAARTARASSVQRRGAVADVDMRTTASTEDAIVRFRLPTAQSSKSEDIVLALSERLLPKSTVRLPRGNPARRNSVAFADRGRPPTAVTLAGRFTTVKHTFTALEVGTSSANAPFGTRRWTVVTYDDVEPCIARTLAALSSGPLGGTIPLQPPA